MKKFRFATPQELAAFGLVPGAVPPFGEPVLPLALHVDPSVLANEVIAFNAGSLTESIILSIEDYSRLAPLTSSDSRKTSSPGPTAIRTTGLAPNSPPVANRLNRLRCDDGRIDTVDSARDRGTRSRIGGHHNWGSGDTIAVHRPKLLIFSGCNTTRHLGRSSQSAVADRSDEGREETKPSLRTVQLRPITKLARRRECVVLFLKVVI